MNDYRLFIPTVGAPRPSVYRYRPKGTEAAWKDGGRYANIPFTQHDIDSTEYCVPFDYPDEENTIKDVDLNYLLQKLEKTIKALPAESHAHFRESTAEIKARAAEDLQKLLDYILEFAQKQ